VSQAPLAPVSTYQQNLTPPLMTPFLLGRQKKQIKHHPNKSSGCLLDPLGWCFLLPMVSFRSQRDGPHHLGRVKLHFSRGQKCNIWGFAFRIQYLVPLLIMVPSLGPSSGKLFAKLKNARCWSRSKSCSWVANRDCLSSLEDANLVGGIMQVIDSDRINVLL
jgi:hypothetical protein